MAETVDFTYRAFLSYAHADSAWAKWLHKRLEGFRIDKDLGGRATEMVPAPPPPQADAADLTPPSGRPP